MRDVRSKLRMRTRGAYAGPPRVADDLEVYTVIAQMAEAKDTPAAISEHVRLWGSPYQNWQLATMVLRAQLVLGALRKELGRREQLDPNQLRLKGL